MPSVFGRDNKKKELIKNLGSIYEKIQREHQISPGDFPEMKRMQVGPSNHLVFYEHLLLAYMRGCIIVSRNIIPSHPFSLPLFLTNS